MNKNKGNLNCFELQVAFVLLKVIKKSMDSKKNFYLFQGKVAVITGASQGIGEEIALQFFVSYFHNYLQ